MLSATWTSSSACCIARSVPPSTTGAARPRRAPLAPALEHAELVRRATDSRADAQEEAVELRLGQRVGALVLDRVLGREHEKRPLERARPPLDRHLALLHRLEQRRLRLRRSAVDLVGEQQVGEDRAGAELELGGALVEHRRAGHVGGHQVGRELDAREAERRRPGRTSARSASSRGRGSPRSARARPRARRAGRARARSRLPTTARSTSSSMPVRELRHLAGFTGAPAPRPRPRSRRAAPPGALVVGARAVGPDELPGRRAEELRRRGRPARRGRSRAREASPPRCGAGSGGAGSRGRTPTRRRAATTAPARRGRQGAGSAAGGWRDRAARAAPGAAVRRSCGGPRGARARRANRK